MLCLHCNITQAADNNKVLSEENKEWFEKFSKTAYFLSFYEQKQTTIAVLPEGEKHWGSSSNIESLLHSTQKVSETNRSQTA